MLAPGSILGDRYRVERSLGSGGMGVVLEATHLQLGTQVAIKILKADADPTAVERFLREARAAAQLQGDHICRVHDFGTLPDKTPYMVMELLRGNDLATELKRRGPLAVPVLARYMLDVCTAMAEAHGRGIIHRDLKPSNLFLSERPDGGRSIKVLDFGIATSMTASDFALTDASNTLGSPAYMSPEQLKSSRNVSARSDIWSLGVVMYELVSGRHPFKGETLTALAINITNDATPPLAESVPGAFAAVVYKCMEKTATSRYRDVAALAAALEPHTGGRANIAGSVARVLTKASGVHAAIPVDGIPTAPALPSNLAEPAPPAGVAANDAEPGNAEPGKVTTLRAASGVVASQPDLARPRRLVVSIAVGAFAVAAVVGFGIWQRRATHSGAPAPTREPAAVPSPVVAPPDPVATPTTPRPPQAAAAPAPAPPPAPAAPPDAAVISDSAPEVATGQAKSETKPPVKKPKPKSKSTAKRGPDLGTSRY